VKRVIVALGIFAGACTCADILIFSMSITLEDGSGMPVRGAQITCANASLGTQETAFETSPGVYPCGTSGGGDWSVAIRVRGVEVEHGIVHVASSPNVCPGTITTRLTIVLPSVGPADAGLPLDAAAHD